MRTIFSAFALFVASSTNASASQDVNDEAQAKNTLVAKELERILREGDVKSVENLPPFTLYIPLGGYSDSQILSPEKMITLFDGCEMESLNEAHRYRDTMLLTFACPGRAKTSRCASGDFLLAVEAGAFRVSERRLMEDDDCRKAIVIPPPAPRSGGEQ